MSDGGGGALRLVAGMPGALGISGRPTGWIGAGANAALGAGDKAGGAMLNGLGVTDLGAAIGLYVPVFAGIAPGGGMGAFVGAVCHAGSGAAGFFWLEPSLQRKHELPEQPDRRAGNRDKPASQGLIPMRHPLAILLA